MPYGGMGAAGEEVSPHRRGTHSGWCSSCDASTPGKRGEEGAATESVAPSDVPPDILKMLDDIAGVVETPPMYTSQWWAQYGKVYRTLTEATEAKLQLRKSEYASKQWPLPPTRTPYYDSQTATPPQNF